MSGGVHRGRISTGFVLAPKVDSPLLPVNHVLTYQSRKDNDDLNPASHFPK